MIVHILVSTSDKRKRWFCNLCKILKHTFDISRASHSLPFRLLSHSKVDVAPLNCTWGTKTKQTYFEAICTKRGVSFIVVCVLCLQKTEVLATAHGVTA